MLRERTIIQQEVRHRCVINRVGWAVPKWIEDAGKDNKMTGAEFARFLVGLLSGAKQEDDAIGDFDDLFDFEEVFEDDYPWPGSRK